MARLTITLFGAVRVLLDGQPVALATDKGLALLIYLAVEAKRPFRREILATLLWPDQPQEKALQNLRQALSNLRRTLNDHDDGAAFLLVDRHTVQFNAASDHWLDVALFTQLAETCRHHAHRHLSNCLPCLRRCEALADLFQGDFLSQFFLSDSASFEEWTLLTRETLRRQAVVALSHLAIYQTRRGDYETAQELVQRQVVLEPWREEAHRDLIRLLTLAGQRSAALRQYKLCRDTLAAELSVPPADETEALYRQIVANELPLPAPLPRPPALIAAAPFVGRETALADLSELLANPDKRLITLTGPGGIGKSRLAQQVAEAQVGLFADGVVWLPLTAVPPQNALLSALAAALNLPAETGRPLLTQITHYLRSRELLLVLDNVDHLLGETAVLPNLLYHAPGLSLLVTSRERLGLQEEWVYLLDGLTLPPAASDPADLGSYSAARLFQVRAQQADRRFDLREQATAVSQICHLLQGLPLGLELAAAWSGSQSCAAIAAALAHSLTHLTSPLNNTPARQGSLRAVCDYSWGLLTPREQAIFSRLSLFRGGFTLSAAAAVVEASSEDLSTLVAKSLLRRSGPDRYELHELLRQYAADQLAQTPALLAQAAAAHAHYYAAWMAAQSARLSGADQAEALRTVAGELENGRTAWQWALAHRALSLTGQFVDGLFHFFYDYGRFQDGLDLLQLPPDWTDDPEARPLWGRIRARQGALAYRLRRYDEARLALNDALPLAADDPAERCFCLLRLAQINQRQGQPDLVREQSEQALALARQMGDVLNAARALFLLGQARQQAGQTEAAQQLLLEGLVLAEQSGNPRLRLTLLNALGDLRCHNGEYAAAAQAFASCLAISQQLGDRFHAAIHLNNLGTVHHSQGEYAAARAAYRESLALCRDLGDQTGEAIALSNLGEVAFALGDLREAERVYRAGLALGRALADVETTLICLNNLAETAVAQRMSEVAATYLAEALPLATESASWTFAGRLLLTGARLLRLRGMGEETAVLLNLLCHDEAVGQEICAQVQTLLNEQPLQPPRNRLPDLATAVAALQSWL